MSKIFLSWIFWPCNWYLFVVRLTWGNIPISALTSVQAVALPPRTRKTCGDTWWRTPTRNRFLANFADKGGSIPHLNLQKICGFKLEKCLNATHLRWRWCTNISVDVFLSNISGLTVMAIWSFTWSVFTIRIIQHARIAAPHLNKPS